MARFDQGKQGLTITYSSIREDPRQERQGNNHVLDMEEVGASPSFFFCCFPSVRGNIDTNGDCQHEESWFVSKLKRLKEFSELVAGPRWKNFIRKIGRYFKPNKLSETQCMYSPNSYVLNFDDGSRVHEEEDDFFVSFSTRLSAAAPPSIDKQRPPTSTRSLL